MEDFFPEEKVIQNKIFESFRQIAVRYNFKEVEAPALETIKLLTKKSGNEIKTQIFTIEKRSQEELGLRFEFTASLARMFIERQKELTKPVKWFSLGKMWRYEQPQAGRLREFYQFDVEIFGSDKPECDAEVINVGIDSLYSVGLKKGDFFVYVNNRKLLQGLLLDFVPKNQMEDILRIIDKRDKITKNEFIGELGFLGEDRIERLMKLLDMPFDKFGNMQMNDMASEGYNELKDVMQYLDSKVVRFDLSTARGLAYYTGTVFEIYEKVKKYRALCGGGRYDDMIDTFGGQNTPATGFGMGYSTVSLLLANKGLLSKIDLGPDYFVAIVGDVKQQAMKLVSRLRKKYSVNYDLSGRNLGNQMKYANSIGAKKLIVFGPDEAKSGKMNVKDMKTGKLVSQKFSDI